MSRSAVVAPPGTFLGIRAAGLTKIYPGGARALTGVSFVMKPGEIVGVIGPNGAGKTTLMGCLLGHLQPTSGIVTVDDLSPDTYAIRKRVGYLPERLRFDPWMTAEEFLRWHCALAGVPAPERGPRAASLLARVGLDVVVGRQLIRRCSRGTLQRIGLAQALAGDPTYLFLDEPTSGMDPAGVLLVRAMLLELRERGMGVVLNSHQLDQVERVCDRILFLRAGSIERDQPVREAADTAGTLRVRILQPSGGKALGSLWTQAAEAAGAVLETEGELDATFAVQDDAAAARLLQELARQGVEVAEAARTAGRLESLFRNP